MFLYVYYNGHGLRPAEISQIHYNFKEGRVLLPSIFIKEYMGTLELLGTDYKPSFWKIIHYRQAEVQRISVLMRRRL